MLTNTILGIALLGALLSALFDTLQESISSKRKIRAWVLAGLVAIGAVLSYQGAIQFENDLEGLRKYSQVAKYNERGVTERIGYGLVESGPMASDLRGAYEKLRAGGKTWIFPRCDHKSIMKFEHVAKKYPEFPFSYSSLAICKRRMKDPEWRMHAEQALKILRHTTSIAYRHPAHDRIRDWMEGWSKRTTQVTQPYTYSDSHYP